MGIKVSLEHRTTYTFDRLVEVHPHVVRLRPAPHSRTRIDAYSMRVTPREHFVNWQQDAFGNFLARLVFPAPARELSITVGLIADLEVVNPFDFFVEDYAEHFPFTYPPALAADLEPYLRPVDESPGAGPGALVRDWVRAHVPGDAPRTIDFLVALNHAVRGDVAYTVRMEPGVQSPDHTLRAALGSCRDSAWLLVSILREFGLAARFVSGYLVQLAQDVPALDGPSGPAADFTDLHAWTEVYVPGAGWVGLDPTSGLFAGEGHIPLSATPHPNSSAPITGATGRTNATLDFANTVRRVHEDPRVTLPYTESQWERITASGAAIDARMAAEDVGLTMGGEPTFVSLDDQTSPEWNTDADGPHKRERAVDLAERLRRIYAPNGIVQYRQGKWYPGEPLPRWEIALAWSADGTPIWTRPDLLVGPWTPVAVADTPSPTASPLAASGTAVAPDDNELASPFGVPGAAAVPEEPFAGGPKEAGTEGSATGDSDGRGGDAQTVGAVAVPSGEPDSIAPGDAHAIGADTLPPRPDIRPVPPHAARALIAHIAAGLALPESQVRPAYEDPLARLARKVRLPEGNPVADDEDLTADSPEVRAELLRRLDDSITEPSAYVLPLYRTEDGRAWASPNWRLRRGQLENPPHGRIVLTEGDSPAGLRLPLDAVSWSEPRPRPERDPLSDTPERDPHREPPGEVAEPDGEPVTALVAEVRDGRIHVFLPPVEELEDFLDLLRRVEDAAAAGGLPIVLEGYAPPADPRLRSLSVTPDPGVIEVNVQPTASFAEQSELLATLYEQARLARLGTESFDVDGTHGGTGGGNHITLGGVTPARSPLLRRPDLLVSMLTYWQRHPALSYLFAGRFVGPTSQAPRVDEGRESALYELEIAFAEIARLTASSARGRDAESGPWHVDRALRHLLTDLTGNTHRAEFCIDKLYSPDSARGRLGLVELRGFEMPPHHRMAMVQSLLVRGLVAKFWSNPLRAGLIRHGANLHGRYLLPHFLMADIAEVAADLRADGIDFDTAWLDPFTEFRFPRIGTVVLGGIEIELRGAIEPWYTLGEQTEATGTARYVDSSVERVQVRVVGADRGRYTVTCNGWPVPLLATENADVQVAGVRYRAWQPPNSLHPSLTVDAPLVFDLIDTESGLSRGGCTYHVSHPGGMAYDDPPVNAVAAQSRRNRRFEAAGHTVERVDPGALRAKMAAQSTDAGVQGILDLRRARTVWGPVSDR
ncbi:transglutaminase family protein [Nocardia puris]|uniref:transglutaminase family protein n=1 Tax=Nocardia puris TaxID=208602 RepID=UPI001894E5B6|nr:transglutaminase family protein [Nocardia puris]MBF6213885.1 transglutaminase family protein [Nocardia puris]MBF6368524.1 transglutaminase family protein [Nocardia puris]MBF6463011.1 transglutaminase family protein [Nocardia puris]